MSTRPSKLPLLDFEEKCGELLDALNDILRKIQDEREEYSGVKNPWSSTDRELRTTRYRLQCLRLGLDMMSTNWSNDPGIPWAVKDEVARLLKESK